jgi:hypothetical protein
MQFLNQRRLSTSTARVISAAIAGHAGSSRFGPYLVTGKPSTMRLFEAGNVDAMFSNGRPCQPVIARKGNR